MKLPAALILSALCPLLSAFAQPNIILMMGDDHGWEETGYHGHPHVKTPVLANAGEFSHWKASESHGHLRARLVVPA